MHFNVSSFGHKFSSESGISQLMNDLGKALDGKNTEINMLGGGNPAQVPEMQSCFREKMEFLLKDGLEFEKLIGTYDPPCGNRQFLESLVNLINETYHWNITIHHIALTNGSQQAFFYLFNLFSGRFVDGHKRKILLPLAPEYIGYTDLGLEPDIFTARKPEIELLPDHRFKYKIDFENLNVTDDIGAISISRPTNPTGNVLTNEEVDKLSQIAQQKGIPLIIDSAYGLPFPHIVFTEIKPFWNPHIIHVLSLSKLGLPSLRTGIVIADPSIIHSIQSMNAIFSLAPGGIGGRLVNMMIKERSLLELSKNIIRPYYQIRSQSAIAHLQEELKDIPHRIHVSEGAIFLWLWLPELKIHVRELYERLKQRGTLIVPGHFFFPGIENADSWSHTQQCLRITYAQSEKVVANGIKTIGSVLKELEN